jgi:S1-C subfamily serine protease
MGLSLLLTALAVLVVGAATAAVAAGATWAAAGVAFFACVVVPVLVDHRITAAFRKHEAGAASTIFQVLAMVNGAWLALLVLLLPSFVRGALERQGAWMLPDGGPPALRDAVARAAAHIPRSDGAASAAPASGRAQTAHPATSAAPIPSQAVVAPSSAAGVALLAPSTGPAIRPPDAVDEDSPAGRVFRDRSASVVVIRTRAPVAKDSPLVRLYDELGLDSTEGLGSGFVVEPAGIIVTNHHVIEGAASLDVALQDGRHWPEVTVLRDDTENDLALISIPVNGLLAAPIAKKDVRIGARAFAIGSPLGLEYSLTEGIVSATRTSEKTRLLQMQTGIAPGSSGGPLLDEHGDVIGVNTATQGANLNLAVHFSHVNALLSAPREPRALAHFEAGPRVTSVEAVGGVLDPTTRMNFREVGRLLAYSARRCVKVLPPDAHITNTFPKKKGVAMSEVTESNLGSEVVACLEKGRRLASMQIGVLLGQLSGGPRGVDIVVGGVGPDSGGATTDGTLRFRFVRAE